MSYKALEGIRVADMGIVTAGASASAILADLGAEVIKVEGPTYTDPFREWSGKSNTAQWWNDSPQFRATNRNKRSVCLDLKSVQGRELFLQLIEHCDVVVENFRAGVLDRLKIGWNELSRANPRVILVSISSQGQTGPNASKISFGSTLEASSGMASLMRYDAEGLPHITGRGVNYPDQVVSLFAAGAVLAALVERERTGVGSMLDLSQRELTSFLIGDALTAAASGTLDATYRAGPPGGFEGIFRCQDGQSVAVTVREPQLTRLTELVGQTASRVCLAEWLLKKSAPEAARQLRTAGLNAEVVVKTNGYADPYALQPQHALARDTQQRQVKGLPMRLGDSDCPIYREAPALGADNEYVARELLGLSNIEFAALQAAGIFSDRPAVASSGKSQ